MGSGRLIFEFILLIRHVLSEVFQRFRIWVESRFKILGGWQFIWTLLQGLSHSLEAVASVFVLVWVLNAVELI